MLPLAAPAVPRTVATDKKAGGRKSTTRAEVPCDGESATLGFKQQYDSDSISHFFVLFRNINIKIKYQILECNSMAKVCGTSQKTCSVNWVGVCSCLLLQVVFPNT